MFASKFASMPQAGRRGRESRMWIRWDGHNQLRSFRGGSRENVTFPTVPKRKVTRTLVELSEI